MAEAGPNDVRSLAEQVTDLAQEVQQETAHRKKATAERAAARTGWLTRERAVLVALIVAFPILVILLVTRISGQSPMDLITPAPPPAVAGQKAQQALDSVVKDIESFREDYSELPASLTELGKPPEGQWTYTKSGGHYQVVVRMHGEVRRFDSQSPRGGS